MRLTLDRDALADVLTWTAQVVPKRPTSPALSGLRLTVSAEALEVTATDYDTTHKANVPVIGAEPGEALVPAFLLRDLVGALKGEVTLTLKDEHVLTLEAGRSRYELHTLALDDYPTPAQIDRRKKALIGALPAETLLSAVGTVSYLVEDEAADIIKGLHLESSHVGASLGLPAGDDPKPALLLVGAESAACSVHCAPMTSVGSVDADLQVPGNVFARAVRGMAGEVRLYTQGGLVEVADSSRSVIMRTFMTKFMPWHKLLRVGHDITAEVQADELHAAARRATIAAEEGTALTLTLDPETGLQIEAGADGISQGVEDVDAQADGEKVFALSPKYLLPALASLAEAQASIGLSAEDRAMIIIQADATTHILAPRRLS